MRYSAKIFHDRADAGRLLGARLRARRIDGKVVVLGLPRGGIPVAFEVAEAIGAPLDVLVVRKLGAPFSPELALGSIAGGNVMVFNYDVMEMLGLDETDLAETIERETQELARRERCYRGDRPRPHVAGGTVVLVDDGAATGATMHAAVQAVRAMGSSRVVVALPTSSLEAARRLEAVADEVIVLSTPEPYGSVGSWYVRFEQLSDAAVVDWLERARAAGPPEASAGP